jgi:hypothetical protein
MKLSTTIYLMFKLYTEVQLKSKNIYGEAAKAAEAAKKAEAQQVYREDRQIKMETQAALDFNTALTVTPAQLKLLKRWAPDKKTGLILAHVIACQQISDARAKKNVHAWVPIPHTWFDEFRLRDAIKGLVERGILLKKEHENKGRYRKGRCARYRLKPKLAERFAQAGLKHIERAKVAARILAPGWSETLDRVHPRATASIPVQRGNIISYQNPLRINATELKAQFDRELAALTNLQGKAKEKAWARMQHCARCIAKIFSQTNDTHGVVHYHPQYIQIEEGLRCYEIGGGYQGLPKDYKRAALTGTGQTNNDIEACHPNIFDTICHKLFNETPIARLTKNGYPAIGTLSRKQVKKVICAIINGASLKASHNQNRAIANICKENGDDTIATKENIREIKHQLTELHALAKKAAKIVERIIGQGRASMSNVYQKIEQENVARIARDNIVANEHDGWVGRLTEDPTNDHPHQATTQNATWTPNITREIFPNERNNHTHTTSTEQHVHLGQPTLTTHPLLNIPDTTVTNEICHSELVC